MSRLEERTRTLAEELALLRGREGSGGPSPAGSVAAGAATDAPFPAGP